MFVQHARTAFQAAERDRSTLLVVGGTGAVHTPRLAGAYADEYNLVGVGPDDVPARLERATAAAAIAGRDPDALLISLASVLVTGETDAEYQSNLASLATRLGREPDDVAASLTTRDAPHGTFEQVTETMERFAATGVRRITIQAVAGVDAPFLERAIAALS